VTGISLRPPQKITIVQSIIDQILAEIRERRLQPGDKLPSERELIAVLGVSRSSVREALQGLIAMNVLESRPGQGTFVKPRTPTYTWPGAGATDDGGQVSAALWKKMRLDLVQARLVIDEAVALAAIQNADAEDLATIGRHLAAYTDAMQPPDRERLLEAHNAFHMAIAESTRNYFLIHMTGLLLEDALPDSLRFPEYTFDGIDMDAPEMAEASRMLAHEAHDHNALYRALAGRNPDAARAAVRQSMQLARDIIEQQSEVMARELALAP